MDISKIIKRSWELTWSFRALWIFGVLLALTTSSGLWFGWSWDGDQIPVENTIKISPESTIYFPGEGVEIDLTIPGEPLIRIDERVWTDLSYVFNDLLLVQVPRDVWVILIAFGIVIALVVIFRILFRYTSEAALIRMVSESETSGEMMSTGSGMRQGWSRIAWRLFLIDLIVFLPVALAFILLFLFAISPLLLLSTGRVAASIFGVTITLGMLVLFVILTFLVSLILSPLMQIFRRACGVDQLGVGGSLRKGWNILRSNWREVLLIWLVWIGVRLGWTLAIIPVTILLFPVVLLFIVLGVVVGAVPALLVSALMSLFYGGITPWIIGAIVGMPVFILVMITPILFLGGLVEVFKSNLWTLTYRDLRILEGRLAEKKVTDLPLVAAQN